MKRLVSALMFAVLTLAFAVEDAEARRLGGGRSLGVQRSIAPSRSVPPPSQAAPAAAGTGAAAAPKPAGSRWLGPIAGLAAGLGLGWLIGQGGFGGMLGTLLVMLLAAFAVVTLIRLLSRPRTADNMQYAGAGTPAAADRQSPPPPGAAPAFDTQEPANIPAGFDSEGFLRQAKLSFVRLQAAFDSGNIEQLREFTTEEMFQSIRRDLQERGASGQQTDVLTLDAELLEVVTEGGTHWASLRFSGMIRENPDARPESFQEIWNLAKPVSGASGWLLAGIQQIQ